MTDKEDAQHVDAVKQNILDGSSKWFAKLAITGKIDCIVFCLFVTLYENCDNRRGAIMLMLCSPVTVLNESVTLCVLSSFVDQAICMFVKFFTDVWVWLLSSCFLARWCPRRDLISTIY